jgi:hypothetical protein
VHSFVAPFTTLSKRSKSPRAKPTKLAYFDLILMWRVTYLAPVGMLSEVNIKACPYLSGCKIFQPYPISRYIFEVYLGVSIF